MSHSRARWLGVRSASEGTPTKHIEHSTQTSFALVNSGYTLHLQQAPLGLRYRSLDSRQSVVTDSRGPGTPVQLVRNILNSSGKLQYRNNEKVVFKLLDGDLLENLACVCELLNRYVIRPFRIFDQFPPIVCVVCKVQLLQVTERVHRDPKNRLQLRSSILSFYMIGVPDRAFDSDPERNYGCYQLRPIGYRVRSQDSAYPFHSSPLDGLEPSSLPRDV
jgi:hypothetical protein